MKRSFPVSTPGTGLRKASLVIAISATPVFGLVMIYFPFVYSDDLLFDLLCVLAACIAGAYFCHVLSNYLVKKNMDKVLNEKDCVRLSKYVKGSPKAANLLRISRRSGKDDAFTYKDIRKLKHRIEALVKKDLLNNSGKLAAN